MSRFNKPVPRRIFPSCFCNKCQKDSPVLIVMVAGNPKEVELIFCPLCLSIISLSFYGKIEWLSRNQIGKRTGMWIMARPNRFNIKVAMKPYVQ